MLESSTPRPLPRSASAGSKMDLKGLSSKLFGGRKNTPSSGSSSPVELGFSSPSGDSQKPPQLALQSSPVQPPYKAPHTPPGSITTPSTASFATPVLGMTPPPARSPPPKSSGATSPARSLTRSSSTVFSDCCFCNVPLDYVLGSEGIAKLKCSHLAHFECLIQLSEVLNKNPRASNKFRLPPCGICDEPSSLAHLALQEKFNKTMNDLIALRVSPPKPQTGSLPPTTPVTSPTENKHSPTASVDCKCNALSCEGTAAGVQFFSQIDGQSIPTSGPAQVKCLVGVSVPNNRFYNNGNLNPLNTDIKLAHQISKLKRLFFKGVSMDRLDTSKLRFATNLKTSSDRCTWSACTLYLFSGNLVLTAKTPEGQTQIKCVIDTKSHLTSVQILGRDSKPHVELIAQALQKYRVYFICENIELLEALCAALHNPALSFPVTAEVNDTYTVTLPEQEGMVLYRSPLDIVLCVEQPYSSEHADAIGSALKSLRASMLPMDRLSIVHRGTTLRTFSFQHANWQGWYRTDYFLRKVGDPFKSVSLDDTLQEAERLLYNLRVERSLACVMVLSATNKVELSNISPGFIYSGTPIHTIGIDDNFDPITLSTLAAKTDGLFCSSQSTELNKKVVELYNHTSRRTHKNVEIKLSAPAGIKIAEVQGWKLPFYDQLEMPNTPPIDSSASDLTYTLRTEPDNTQTVPVGSLYEDTFKSIIVTLDIEDCSKLSKDSILDMTLFSRSPQSISHHRCTFTTSVSPKEYVYNCELLKYEASLDARDFAREMCELLANGQNKRVFQLTQTPRAKFSSRYTIKNEDDLSEACKDSVKEQLQFFDGFFDDFSDKLFQPHAALTGELLNFIWKYSCKHPRYFD